ncbi:hypothetical protein UP10_35415 [Bradyrhizobium sp. LTSPM299]|nr:hypothetical protein UP10_35415 [Bradyrhizobium sp. LTSPM299]
MRGHSAWEHRGRRLCRFDSPPNQDGTGVRYGCSLDRIFRSVVADPKLQFSHLHVPLARGDRSYVDHRRTRQPRHGRMDIDRGRRSSCFFGQADICRATRMRLCCLSLGCWQAHWTKPAGSSCRGRAIVTDRSVRHRWVAFSSRRSASWWASIRRPPRSRARGFRDIPSRWVHSQRQAGAEIRVARGNHARGRRTRLVGDSRGKTWCGRSCDRHLRGQRCNQHRDHGASNPV